MSNASQGLAVATSGFGISGAMAVYGFQNGWSQRSMIGVAAGLFIAVVGFVLAGRGDEWASALKDRRQRRRWARNKRQAMKALNSQATSKQSSDELYRVCEPEASCNAISASRYPYRYLPITRRSPHLPSAWTKNS